MTYHGHVRNGQIAFDEPVSLPDGAEVNVEVIIQRDEQPTIWDKLLAIAGTVEGPEDWAENHDHYIHGTPKRQ